LGEVFGEDYDADTTVRTRAWGVRSSFMDEKLGRSSGGSRRRRARRTMRSRWMRWDFTSQHLPWRL